MSNRVKINSAVRFVDPWDKVSIVGGEVIEIGESSIAVNYQGSVVVLAPVADENGLYKVYQF